MFKFLRKYNKWILAVGGTLLMIVFLIPQAIEGLAQSAGTGRATRATLVGADGREQRITWAQWEQTVAEFELVNRLAGFGEIIPGVGTLNGAAHWYLLTREAADAGLVGPPGATPITEEQLRNLAARPDVLRRTMPKLEGVMRLVLMYQNAGEVSDVRLRQYSRKMFHSVEADLVVIPAQADEVDIQPTEDQLQAQLEAFADVAPGEGEMGFGYRLPDRVKIEWLSIQADDVRESIRNSDRMSNIALRAHWTRELRKPDTDFPPIPENDPTIPEVVREHLLEQLTTQQLDTIAKFANDQFRASRRGIPQRDGYFILPDDWSQRQVPLPQLASEMQERFQIQTPEYHAVGDRWLDLNELRDLEGVGEAQTDRYGTQPRDLYDLVSAAREFGGSPIMQLQQGIAGPPLRTPDGSVHVFRIVDVDASRAPRSVDEVREQLVTDLQRRAHYEQLLGQVSGIEQQARQEGLLATAMDFDQAIQQATVTLTDFQAINQQMMAGQSPTPVPTNLPGIGRNRDATEAIIDHALTLPAGTGLDEVPVDQRILAMPVDDALAILVVYIRNNVPLTQEVFTQSASDLKFLMLNEELQGRTAVRDAFNYDALVERYQFRLFSQTGDEEEEELLDLDELDDLG